MEIEEGDMSYISYYGVKSMNDSHNLIVLDNTHWYVTVLGWRLDAGMYKTAYIHINVERVNVTAFSDSEIPKIMFFLSSLGVEKCYIHYYRVEYCED